MMKLSRFNSQTNPLAMDTTAGTLEIIWKQGHVAARRGDPKSKNPYPSGDKHEAWLDGWEEGQP